MAWVMNVLSPASLGYGNIGENVPFTITTRNTPKGKLYSIYYVPTVFSTLQCLIL